MMIQRADIEYVLNKAELEEDKLIASLYDIGDLLPIKLREKVVIGDYLQKILAKGKIIIAKHEEDYVGIIAYYDNDSINRKAYVSILGVKSSFQGIGIASTLMRMMEDDAIKSCMNQNCLHVNKSNERAIAFYRSRGYVAIAANKDSFLMTKLLAFPFKNITPIIELPSTIFEKNGIELMVKLDGLISYPYGGNKGRKAIYFLNYALYNNYTHLVTNGGIDSNHVRAIAIGCQMLGLECHIILHYEGSDVSYYDSINYKILKSLTHNIKVCKNDEIGKYMDDEIELIKKEGGKPLYIWGGGHSPLGTMAYYDAFQEYTSQLGNSEVRPNYIFLATGTGTTQAGLLAGNKGDKTKIIGISISRDRERQTNVIKESLNSFYSYFGIGKEMKGEEIEVVDRYLGNGYGALDDRVLNTIDDYIKKGIILDPVYTGKAFYGMLQEIENNKIEKGSRVLFWHTGGFMNYIEFKNSTQIVLSN